MFNTNSINFKNLIKPKTIQRGRLRCLQNQLIHRGTTRTDETVLYCSTNFSVLRWRLFRRFFHGWYPFQIIYSVSEADNFLQTSIL